MVRLSRAVCRFIAPAIAAFLYAETSSARVDISVRGAADSEYDSNANRKEGSAGEPDGVTRLLLRSRVVYLPERESLLQLAYDAGGKIFYRLRTEDFAVQSAALLLRHQASHRIGFGAETTLKDKQERLSETDYFTSSGSVFLDIAVARRATLRLRLGFGSFAFKPLPEFGYMGDAYTLEARASVGSAMGVAGIYRFARNGYSTLALANIASNGTDIVTAPSGSLRGDQAHAVEARWELRRPVFVEAGYRFEATLSNSFGFTYYVHRLWGHLSGALPGGLQGHLFLALQLLAFKDPVFLDPTFFIEDDNRSTISVKLARPLWKDLFLEARYSVYMSPTTTLVTRYERHVVGLGLVVQME